MTFDHADDFPVTEAPDESSGTSGRAAFVMPEEPREHITHEPEPAGTHTVPYHEDVEWIGHANQGGGYVSSDYAWGTNPKQRQEETSHG